MRQVWILTSYLLRELLRSLTGGLVVVGGLAFYLIAIHSVTGGVDQDYYALVIGGFFGVVSLLLTLIIADRSYRSASYLLLYRLSSRAIFLAAIVLAAVLVTGVLEIIVAVLSLTRLSVPLTAEMGLDIVPVWISLLALGAALGLHVSELVRRGWSRTVTYGVLAAVLFSLNQRQGGAAAGLADKFNWIPSLIADTERWKWANDLVDVLIWPIVAAVKVARATPYSLLESLSPALLLLVAMVLFWLAVALFGGKDLILPES